jgi:hypothetical protein
VLANQVDDCVVGTLSDPGEILLAGQGRAGIRFPGRSLRIEPDRVEVCVDAAGRERGLRPGRDAG